MRASFKAPLALAAMLISVVAARRSEPSIQLASAQATGKKIDANLTELPTYPRLTFGLMRGHPPKEVGLYDAATNDSYDRVLAWYRAKLPKALEEKSDVGGTKGMVLRVNKAKWTDKVVISARRSPPGTLLHLEQRPHP